MIRKVLSNIGGWDISKVAKFQVSHLIVVGLLSLSNLCLTCLAGYDFINYLSLYLNKSAKLFMSGDLLFGNFMCL